MGGVHLPRNRSGQERSAKELRYQWGCRMFLCSIQFFIQLRRVVHDEQRLRIRSHRSLDIRVFSRRAAARAILARGGHRRRRQNWAMDAQAFPGSAAVDQREL